MHVLCALRLPQRLHRLTRSSTPLEKGGAKKTRAGPRRLLASNREGAAWIAASEPELRGFPGSKHAIVSRTFSCCNTKRNFVRSDPSLPKGRNNNRLAAAPAGKCSILALPVPKNLRSFLCITVVWLCHPQLALWAWQSGHPESSAVPAQQLQSSSASASGSLPDVPDADELPRLEPLAGPGKTLVPVHIAANTQRKDGPVYTLLGEVEIRYKDYVLHADKMSYNEDTGEARAEGHVELDGGPADEHILADHATLNLNLDTGRFDNVTGSVGVRENVSRKRVIYTTTNPFLFSAVSSSRTVRISSV